MLAITHRRIGRGLMFAVCTALTALFFLNTAHAADIKLEELTAAGETYKKVTIMSKTENDLFITHAGGFANIKVIELDDETRVKLGYDAPRRARGSSGAKAGEALDLSQFGALSEASENEQVQEAQAKVQAFLDDLTAKFDPKHLLMAAVGILASLYFFACFCFHSLCKKTGNNPGIVVWLPILQVLPLLKAAGMGAWWFFIYVATLVAPLAALPLAKAAGNSPVLLLLLIPYVLAAVGWIVWCFKICAARGVSLVFGFLLLMPLISNLIVVGLVLGMGTNPAAVHIPGAFLLAPQGICLLAFLYLCFGSINPDVALRSNDPRTARWGKSRAQDTSFFLQG